MTTFKLSKAAVLQWLQWLAATALGMAGGWGLAAIFITFVQPMANLDTDLFLGFMIVLSLGVLTGILQGWLLRNRLPHARWWIPATLCGYLVVLVSISNKFHLTSFKGPGDDIALMACLGMALGLPQYWVLKQHFQKAGWWILACAVGMQALSLGSVTAAHNMWELVWLGFLMGAILGAVTGIMLVWLLQSNEDRQIIYQP